MGVMLPFVPLARREGELPVGGVECASIGEVVMIILCFVGWCFCSYSESPCVIWNSEEGMGRQVEMISVRLRAGNLELEDKG